MKDKKVKLFLGDNLISLKEIPNNSIDSIVCDPPYALNFMGKKWDHDVPTKELWEEVLRVLKPGGHLLAFGGTRTYHRLVVNIEDAGFEIRDQIQWLYGSGFPKSRNIGKDIEKRKVGGIKNLKKIGSKKGLLNEDGTNGYSYKDEYVAGVSIGGKQIQGEIPVYEINNDYGGWGSALKPANEPICLARKPLSEKTIADNVIKWGTGGINIDECRIGSEERTTPVNSNDKRDDDTLFGLNNNIHHKRETITEGRFPANIILDEEAGRLLDEQSGIRKSTGSIRKKDTETDPTSFDMKKKAGNNSNRFAGEEGGASRFFYSPKVSKKERNMGLDDFEYIESDGVGSTYAGNQTTSKIGANPDKKTQPKKNTHTTLKPVSLMRYLCRLITPKGGIILDPFLGSGSTGIAARLEGFKFCGMEQEEEYMKIAEARIKAFEEYRKITK